jgi:hypothetical protein
MTTKEAARQYLAEHQAEYAGRPVAVHNPHGKPMDQLPVIYGWNNGGGSGWFKGCLVAEDGTWLGAHICSDEAYMLADLGIVEGSRPDRHEGFREHYPNGYRMQFVRYVDARSHVGLTAALDRRRAAAAVEGGP